MKTFELSGSALHAAFRKGLDSPVSAILFNVVKLLPDDAWVSFCAQASGRIAARGRFDAAVLRRACLEGDVDLHSGARELRNMLVSGLQCLGVRDWVALAQFLRAYDPEHESPRSLDEAAIIEELALPPDKARTSLDVLGLEGEVLASVVTVGGRGRRRILQVRALGAEPVDMPEGTSTDAALLVARSAVWKVARARPAAAADPARVAAMASVSSAPALDPDVPEEARLLAAGFSGTVLLRKPSRGGPRGDGLTVYGFDAEANEFRAWFSPSTPDACPVRIAPHFDAVVKERLSRTGHSEVRGDEDVDLTAGHLAFRRIGEAVEYTATIRDLRGEAPVSVYARPWTALAGFRGAEDVDGNDGDDIHVSTARIPE